MKSGTAFGAREKTIEKDAHPADGLPCHRDPIKANPGNRARPVARRYEKAAPARVSFGPGPRQAARRRCLTLGPRSYTSAVSKRAFCPLNGPIAVATARQITGFKGFVYVATL